MYFPFQLYEYIDIHIIEMRVWLNGKISLCQGEDAGSIPATRPSHGI
jgi:hypothetical protein